MTVRRIGALTVPVLLLGSVVAVAAATPASQPVGKMVAAGDFAAAAVLVPGGAVLTDSTGSQPNTVAAFDPASLTLLGQTQPHDDVSTDHAPWAQSGHLALSSDGSTLYASGGASNVVDTFAVEPTGVVQTGTVAVPEFAGGVAVDGTNSALFVAQPFAAHALYNKGSTLLRVDLASGTTTSATVGRVPWDVATGSVGGRELVAVANRDDATVSVLDAGSLGLVRTIRVGRQPAAPTFTSDGHLLTVSTLDDTLTDADPLTGRVLRTVRLGVNPHLLGAGPSALAVSPDGHRVYVAVSGDNAIAVLSRLRPGADQIIGRYPTAGYPTGVVLDTANNQLLVTAGTGVGGTEVVPIGTPILDPVEATNPGTSGLGVSSVLESIPLTTPFASATRTDSNDNEDQAAPDMRETVKHVVYVIRENKTYDEEFGDMPGGDPGLAMYPQQLTPNAHGIASQFVTLTNFYADEEVSDTAHQVLMGSESNDWVQRLSQQAYGLDGTPRQGAELGNTSDLLWSASNYLLDDALSRGISFRDYGEFYRREQSGTNAAVSPELASHIENSPGFGFAPDVPDTQRIAYWKQQFAGDIAAGTFPSLEVLYLPEDHTTEDLSGTPQQQVADADVALGQLVDTLSHSPYWGSTVVLMSEDDPQSGLDHVDEHRTIGLIAGGPVRTGVVDNTRWDQDDMLRTAEVLLGLPPLTEHDAGATPMTSLIDASGGYVAPSYDVVAPVVPSVSPALQALLRAEARRLIPSGPRTEDVDPAVQLRLQWAATHHGANPPVGR